MQVQYRLKLGQDEFLLSFDCKNEKDFFEQACFYSNLPRVAPGGSDDLKIVFRKTKKGHKYYSLLSDKEKKEYKFGQLLEANGNGLFAKGWEDAYQTDDEGDEAPAQGGAVAIGGVGPGVQTSVTPQAGQGAAIGGIQTPVNAPAPNPPAQAPFTMPTPVGTPPPTASPIGIGAPQTTAASVPAPTPAATAQPPVNPQVAKAAGDVLKRFGINANR